MTFNFDNSYIKQNNELYSICKPAPVEAPNLLVLNKKLASELGLDTNKTSNKELADIFSGNTPIDNSSNIAQAYCGHQFGYFNKLGDGRAILLGEQISPNKERFDIQLKGSGITPYSRRGDGRATTSSMLREYLMSESMYALGVPTTRALAVVNTGEQVYREQVQEGAVLTRIASSHIRVGTFQYIARFCNRETLHEFTNYCIHRHYPKFETKENKSLLFLEAVMKEQIKLSVEWMRVGFIHGVMNTDNMTISGETIDYGPCAFMNTYDPATVYSSIDREGRYAFGNQPKIALWNLTRLAETLLPLFDADEKIAIEKAQGTLNTFNEKFTEKYSAMICQKIGLSTAEEADILLANKLLDWMYRNKADYTNTFVEIMYPGLLKNEIYQQTDFFDWLEKRKNRMQEININSEDSLRIMQKNNPVYIPRNKQVEAVLEHASKIENLQTFNQYLELLSNPYCTTDFKIAFMEGKITQDQSDYRTFCGT